MGYDSTTDSVMNGISGSTYSGYYSLPQIITLPASAVGDYTVTLCATNAGSATFAVTSLGQDGGIVSSYFCPSQSVFSNELLGATFNIAADGAISGGALSQIGGNTSPTIIIKSDGTVSPSNAPMSISGSTFTLTSNFAGQIVVQDSGSLSNPVVVNGNFKTLSGSGFRDRS